MVVVRVLPLDIADGVARRTEREPIGVDVVADAGRPVVRPLCVAGPAPVIAAVVGAAHAAGFAAVLLHFGDEVGRAGGDGAEECVGVVGEA